MAKATAAEGNGSGTTPMQRLGVSRAKVAGTILLVAAAAVAFGEIRMTYLNLTYNYWQSRLVRGRAVTVRFICGTDTVIDCKDEISLTYRKKNGKWCENLSRNGGPIISANWCNANPEAGTVSLYGAPHSFDRFGAVTRAGHLVGQMFSE
jgi:hypothetical protein